MRQVALLLALTWAITGEAAALTSQLPDPEVELPDSIAQAISDRRHMRASLLLRSHLSPLRDAPLESRVLLANTEAGWKNWDGVVEALTAGDPDRSGAPSRYWYLLGRAQLEVGNQAAAAHALGTFLQQAPEGTREVLVALSLLARTGATARPLSETTDLVATLRQESPVLADWTALATAESLSDSGEVAGVRQLLDAVTTQATRSRGWHLETDAWLAAGDTAQALEALAQIQQSDGDDRRPSRLDLLDREWRYRIALGDTAGALQTASDVLAQSTRGGRAMQAAQSLIRHSVTTDAETLLRAAAALTNGGDYANALVAWSAVEEAGAVLTYSQRLSRARAYSRSGNRSRAVEEYRALSVSDDPEIAAPALRAWAGVRQAQGRHGDVRILEARLLDRFPTRPESVDIVFFRGDNHQDAGRLDSAVDHYRQVIGAAPASDRAGLARMRWGQIHLARGETEEALSIFTAYLDEFPDGRRWEEAAYWGAQVATELGKTELASSLHERLRRESPVSYYSWLARDDGWLAVQGVSDESSEPSVFTLAEGPQLPDPDWLLRGLETVALLDDAGLTRGAAAHIATMEAATRGSDELVLRLAAGLNEMGRARDGIGLGLDLRRGGRDWDLALLRVVYPFPYRELVTSRATELGLDPYLMAAIIRQESAFTPDARSPAGAIGLMQVMPTTGRDLARRDGIGAFHTGTLTSPELNVLLGSRFLEQMWKRYDGDLPLVLSAYNAGPTRANRWRNFPEAEDPLRFTERIPFAETRSYVKIVTRNRALYEWLYGAEGSEQGVEREP